ncbi:sensor domain-containing protein [Photobacterium alginatilyticum]|uniref:sensor domain-containing protein n=1 Tax=Photobacterium alginatilyticum TaxID=1775171 RepID=UPI0040687481
MNAKGWEDNTLTAHEQPNVGDGLYKNTSTSLVSKLKDLQKKTGFFYAIVHQSSNAVVITDSQRNILYVNKKFEEISGYTLSDVLGKNPRVLQSGKTPENTYQQMNMTLAQGYEWKGEFTNIHKDGHEYTEEAVITPIKDEVGKVVYYLAEKADITALKLAQNKIHSLAYQDSLTGLPNRMYFVEELKKLIHEFVSNRKKGFSVLFADLNRFKEINDTRGHLSGDIVLKEVASRFAEVVNNGDILARIGGDEFVFLHRHTSETSAPELAKRLSGNLQAPFFIDGHEHYIGVSIGSATYPADGDSVKQLLQCADIAMYHAKALKSLYSAYQSEMGTKRHREWNIARKLEKAADKNQFYLMYQPKVDIKTGRLIGAEALLRWQNPELGEVYPAEFIPVAEQSGQMFAMGQWVIRQVCCQLKQWELGGLRLAGRLAINLSIQQVEHPDFYDQLVAIIESAGVSPSQIELEVTESVLMTHPESTSETLTSLTKLGFTIAIDDFGTGYSSLAYLKKIQASILKIDKSFIKNITINADDKTIVKSVVEMAHNLGLRVVAEGVEHQSQADYLSLVECDMAQGFLYSYPLTAKGFALMLNTQVGNK